MSREEKITEAKRLRGSGLSYSAIGKVLGIGGETARRWINPGVAELQLTQRREKWRTDDGYRQRELSREAKPENRQRHYENNRKRLDTDLGRCKRVLEGSKYRAGKRGHVACTASPEELMEALTEYCDCCGVAESSLPKKLAMDHCHATGRFRGWLCDNCNHAVGKLGDTAANVLAYLDPYSAHRLLQARIEDFQK